ncbi:MAG: hypothetical protein AB1746_05810 [Candidatus Zixiibacteriota bacterium]
MKRILTILLAITSVISVNAFASIGNVLTRNIDFSVEIDNESPAIGAEVLLSYSFILRPETDSMAIERYKSEDSILLVKTYLFVNPTLEFLSGDSIWWGSIKYNVKYSFQTRFMISRGGRIDFAPVVETCRELNKAGHENVLTSTIGKRVSIFVKETSKEKEYIDIIRADTIKLIEDFPIPNHMAVIDTSLADYINTIEVSNDYNRLGENNTTINIDDVP